MPHLVLQEYQQRRATDCESPMAVIVFDLLTAIIRRSRATTLSEINKELQDGIKILQQAVRTFGRPFDLICSIL
jgi:hypothetical protein